MNQRKQLREILARPGITVVPGAFDCIGARIIQTRGFEAFYVTGGGVSAALIGKPDVGLVTMSETVRNVTNMCDTVDIPAIVDADTGYGNALNVRQTVRELERAGAAAVQIEDQVFPKKCGHFEGKSVVPAQEMVQKIHAACDARDDNDLVIVARTDSLAVNGFDEAVERGHLYAEAGADLLFIEALRTPEQIEQIGGEYDVPVLFNMAASGKTPSTPVNKLAEYGYKLACFAGVQIWAYAKAIDEEMALLKETGDIESFRHMLMPFFDFWELMGLSSINEAEKRYAVAE